MPKEWQTSERSVSPDTILSWRRQFQQLGGNFKRDGRGVREREWLLSEENLAMELLGWLKAQKRVTTKTTHKFINETLLAREGGILKLAEYGLSLPISMTTTNVWMRKLGCTHDKVKQSYYTDGHERPDVQETRKVYLRKQQKHALRKPSWMRVEWSSLTEKEQEAFDERRETGEDAFGAETFQFEMGGKEYVEFHVDFLGAGSDERYDDLRKGLGEEGGMYSVRFDKAAAAPCKHFHAPEVCGCNLPLYHIGQDESVYKAYAREGTEWVIRGVRGLRKKSDGPGEMVSAFQDEKRGFGLPLSPDELARVNENRQRAGRVPLETTPGLGYLLPGIFMEWLERRLTPAYKAEFKDKKMILVLDNASYHHGFDEEVKVPETNTKKHNVELLRRLGARSIKVKRATNGRVVEHNFEVPSEPGTSFPNARQKGGVSREEVAAATREYIHLHHPEKLEERVVTSMWKKGWELIWTPPYMPTF